MIGNPEAGIALALTCSTLIKDDQKISIEVPIRYPLDASAPLLQGVKNSGGVVFGIVIKELVSHWRQDVGAYLTPAD